MPDDSRQPTHHGYAVNVKDNALYDGNRGTLTDADVQAIWDGCAEGFWDSVQGIGAEYGFENVYSEGRMGGWAVPSPQPKTDDMWEDEANNWVRDIFRPFERDVLAEMESWQEAFTDELSIAVAWAAGEPARRVHEADEAAHWAARDVQTFEAA